jgi:hypothetical protein
VIFDKELTALGFSPFEIGAIGFVLVRLGLISPCEHLRPRFVKCFTIDETEGTEQRWQQWMQEMGFGPDAIELAEHAIFDGDKLRMA